MAEVLLELTNVSKYYTSSQSVVMGLNSVSLSFARGEFVAITGESGSGKSTLAHILGGILPYESGEMSYKGHPTSHYGGMDWERYRRDNVSFISQSYGILPGATVMRNVMSALILVGMDKASARKSAGDILRRVDLWELRNRRAAKLSSGQKQRLSIARALAKPASILIADEPTGNLDAENSGKIIQLLADAARERLVILITHEFDEAKDYATRHVGIQDGRIAADTALRPTPEPGPAPTVGEKKRRFLSPYVARLQCVSRPVWTALLAVFFAATAFAVFAFLGVFIAFTDDTTTRRYDASAFLNGDPTRIIFRRGDGKSLTDEDMARVLSISHTKAVEPWACVQDVQYAYREGVDFDIGYDRKYEVGPGGDVAKEWLEIRTNVRTDAPYLQTIPCLPEGQEFLTDGRLPENFYEVVASDPDLKIGDVILVYIRDVKKMSALQFTHYDMVFQVVGRTDYGSGLFFHQDVGRFCRQLFEMGTQSVADHGYVYIPNNPIPEEKYPEEAFEKWWKDEDKTEFHRGVLTVTPVWEEGTFWFPKESRLARQVDVLPEERAVFTFRSDDADENGNYRTVQLLPAYDEVELDDDGHIVAIFAKSTIFSREMPVDYPTFDILTWKTRDQASVTIDHYAYTDQVLNALAGMGYTAASVYRQGAAEQDPELARERIQTLWVCLLVLLAVAVLQVVILKALFTTENESFRLLSNIGLTGATAKRSVCIQIGVFAILGEIIGAVGIAVCHSLGVQKIVEMMRFMPPKYLLLLVAVHMALSILAAVWVADSLGKQVFPQGTAEHDIDLGDEKEATEA